MSLKSQSYLQQFIFTNLYNVSIDVYLQTVVMLLIVFLYENLYEAIDFNKRESSYKI